ncbi:hypothetical protein WALSEDRAFT_48849 [Wallemia mellicola CBS 633.66]|uniref:DUF202 domain-containing protein n=1 Tax=Wallemia mellicola (strain ATCC MYA-4683 / CBS 633.66) TaxID=671144 RepID=I4Y6J3_WALMC|nr:hypothetical protein WALSEDRAFT_48849 [Wallemia mellicola CBS 633.66]EIM19585.1 hypothetical protein WALSEDRAFT_48849 [Wallemia mellicola CBS 633.66]|eukprot:XP_006960383.1 hypothetical protein WALSEDRAFT_48849 [Wallemia mellicola CBS 633.66]
MLKIFSNKALKLLPNQPVRSKNYNKTITLNGKSIKKPNKIPSTAKVEPKVYLANERTFISYLNVSVLLLTLALTMYNTSSDNLTRWFSGVYIAISLAIIIYSYIIYNKRLEMINNKSSSHFDQLAGPLFICASLFLSIIYNFYIRIPF